GSGGGIYSEGRGGTVVTVTTSTGAGNSVGSRYPGQGGGIYVQSGIPNPFGGSFPGGRLTLVGSTVANNQATGTGGGLWVGATRTQVSAANTIVAGNTAATGGPDASGAALSTPAHSPAPNGD